MEQKFKDFLTKYNGTFVEKVDLTNLNQCVDLIIAWVEFLGLPTNTFAGLMYAYEMWSPSTAAAAQKFDYILNTPDAVPQWGDIVIWDKAYNGTAGHVGIATGNFSDTNKFQCFEQNDPTGSNSHLKDYNYNHVIGWLRYKGPLPQSDALTACLNQHTQLVTELDNLKTQCALDIKTINSQKDSLALQLAECQRQSKIYKDEYDKANSPTGYKAQISSLEIDKRNWVEKEKSYLSQIEKLTKKATLFTSPIKNILSKIYDLLIKP